MCPISVRIPVAVTTPRPRPAPTVVPLNTMLRRSARATLPARGAVSFGTGTLSPVRAASFVRSAVASISRASAGIASPSSSRTMSPGTSPVAGISRSVPSRITRARAADIRRNAAMASAARASWT